MLRPSRSLLGTKSTMTTVPAGSVAPSQASAVVPLFRRFIARPKLSTFDIKSKRMKSEAEARGTPGENSLAHFGVRTADSVRIPPARAPAERNKVGRGRDRYGKPAQDF